MYKIFADSETIHDPGLDDSTRIVFGAKISQQANMADSLEFTIYPNNPGAAAIHKLTSVIEVYQDTDLLFRGRPIQSKTGWDNQITYTCEGGLAVLNDTILRPYSYTGPVRDYLQMLITQHNNQVPAGKQITLRTVTVTDPNNNIVRSNSNYVTTMAEIQEKLVGNLGGYLVLEYSQNDGWILDYLDTSNSTTSQTITIAKNLLDLIREQNAENIATALIPLGAVDEATGERITIKSVNSGLDYIVDQTAAAQYGLIFATETWDDVTLPANLLTKAQARLTDYATLIPTIQMTAVDLSLMDQAIEPIRILDYVTVQDDQHTASGQYLVTQRAYNLSDPAADTVTFGGVAPTITGASARVAAATQDIPGRILATASDRARAILDNATDGAIQILYNEDGVAYELRINNSQNPATATKWWRYNSGGWGYTADGGQTYTVAATMDGALLASMIKTGILQSDDGTTFYLDLDNGVLKGNFSELTISGAAGATQSYADNKASAAQQAASDELDEFIYGQYTNDLADIQAQLDGQIEQYFDSYVPTLNNAPANTWTTTTDKDNHLGDLFYVVDDPDHGGETYRFVYTGGVYKWDLVEDTGVATAIQTANDAYELAGKKRRVFVEQPTPPYEVGDLWVQGSAGDIMRCRTTRASGNYNSADWVKASKYTDDSAFTSFRDNTYAEFVLNTNDGISSASDAASIAQETANAKITTYYQASAPSTHNTGDLWIDTDDSNKLYRWNGSSWVNVRDTGIQSALTAAGDAQSTADKKIVTFAQNNAPTGTVEDPLDIGDLWIDTNDNNKMYRWSGSAWVSYTDTSALNAFKNGDYANFVANTNRGIQSAIDTANTKITTFYQTSAPANPNEGDLWIDTDDGNKLYRYNGFSWINIQDEGIQDALSAASDAQTTADGKIVTFAQASAPTGTAENPLDVGDLWIETDNYNKLYRWSGNSWVAYSDSSEVQAYDQHLNQEAVFNKLTNNRANQGIYIDSATRNLYVNASLIMTGTLNAQRIGANSISVDKLTGNINNNGWVLDLTRGTFTIGKITANDVTVIGSTSLTSKLNSVDSSITGLNNDVTDISSSLTVAEGNITSLVTVTNDIRAETRNLLLNTATFDSWTLNNGSWGTVTGASTLVNLGCTYANFPPVSSSSLDWSRRLGNFANAVKLPYASIRGRKITVSAWVYLPSGTTITGADKDFLQVELQLYPTGASARSWYGLVGRYSQNSTPAIVSGWNRIYSTFVANDSFFANEGSGGAKQSSDSVILIFYAYTPKQVIITTPQIEYGDTCTAWAPNPEDTSISSAYSKISQNESNINLKVSKDSIISEINQTAESVKIKADKIEFEGTVTANNRFKINLDGSMETIKGVIGNWRVESSGLYRTSTTTPGTASTQYEVGINANDSNPTGTVNAMYVVNRSYNGSTYGSWNWPFYVRYDGMLHCTKLDAIGGNIGNWDIGTNGISKSTTLSGKDYGVGLWSPATPVANTSAFYVQNVTDSEYPFRVTYDGSLYATKATITGSITATSLSLDSGITIGGGHIGTGINGSNITTGTIAAARISTDLLRSADLSSSIASLSMVTMGSTTIANYLKVSGALELPAYISTKNLSGATVNKRPYWTTITPASRTVSDIYNILTGTYFLVGANVS